MVLGGKFKCWSLLPISKLLVTWPWILVLGFLLRIQLLLVASRWMTRYSKILLSKNSLYNSNLESLPVWSSIIWSLSRRSWFSFWIWNISLFYSSIKCDYFWIVSLKVKLPYNTSFIMLTVWIIRLVIASFVSFAALFTIFYWDLPFKLLLGG